nr:hypothetical protein [Lentilactobacillus kisonensis]
MGQEPRTGALQKNNPGNLRIYGRQSFFSQFEVSLLASRVDSFRTLVSTELQFNPIHYSQSAGWYYITTIVTGCLLEFTILKP